MKRMLMIVPEQYGYHVDWFNYCRYLKDMYDITYICFDEGLEKINNTGIKVIYIKNRTNRVLNKLIYHSTVIKNIIFGKFTFIFINYFRTCSIYTIFKSKKILLNIRTAAVMDNQEERDKYNDFLSKEAERFSNVAVISKGIERKLNLRNSNILILPLGADNIVESDNISKADNIHNKIEFNLLYVGTFDFRRIEDTVIGFKMFRDEYRNYVDCKYTIVGFANNKIYEQRILDTIRENGLTEEVIYVGRVSNSNLGEYFKDNNIGISYVPIEERYQYQPPTKTYEYIMNGLICLATRTFENSRIIDDDNGVLIEDNVDGFKKGLETIYKNMDRYDRREIINRSKKYSWKDIVNNKLYPYLSEI